jgi:hypothetical protein
MDDTVDFSEWCWTGLSAYPWLGPALGALLILTTVCLVMSCRRAGIHWSVGLLNLIPVVGLVALLVVGAAAEWPIERSEK